MANTLQTQLRDLARQIGLDIGVLNGDVSVEGSVSQKISTALGVLTVGAEQTINVQNAIAYAVGARSNGKDPEDEGYVAGSGIYADIEALEKALGDGGNVETQITTAIEALDASVDSADGESAGTYVNVAVTEEDGVITAVDIDETGLIALIGSEGSETVEASGLKGDIKALQDLVGESDVATQITTAIEDLDADFTGENAVSDDAGFVTVGIKEEDGIITSVTVATDDIASADALSTLDTYVGKASVAGSGNPGDEEGYVAPQPATGLTAKVEALEALAGTKSVEDQISEAIGDLSGFVSAGDDPTAPETVADALSNEVEKIRADFAQEATKAYTVKGSLTSVEDLPTEGNTIGDVYGIFNASAKDYEYNGRNFVYVETGGDFGDGKWDDLGGMFAYKLKASDIEGGDADPVATYIAARDGTDSDEEQP